MLVAVGLNQKGAGVADRELLALPADGIEEALSGYAALDGCLVLRAPGPTRRAAPEASFPMRSRDKVLVVLLVACAFSLMFLKIRALGPSLSALLPEEHPELLARLRQEAA